VQAVASVTTDMGDGAASLAPSRPSSSPTGQAAVSDRRGFRPDLQGIRAVAILAVVAYHVGLPGFSGGYVGVDIFFVLSGYLITGLLVREVGSNGRLSFRRFYARRIRRLLPVSALVLLVTLLISALLYSPLEMRQVTQTAGSVALYVSNFVFASRAVSYVDAGTVGADPFLHTWSLAVEEQFYLVWPMFIALLMWAGTRLGGRRRVLTTGIVAMTVCSFALCLLLTTGTRHPWAFFASPPRFWEFAIGGLASLAPVSWFTRKRVAAVLTVLGAVIIAVPIVMYGESTPFPGTTTLVPVAGTVMLLLAGAAGVEAAVGRPLRTRVALWFGERSYSWYLWHWPALIFVGVLWPSAGLVAKSSAVLVALGASVLTFRYIEQPVRYNRSLAARPRRSLALGLAVTVSCALVAGAAFVRADAATKTRAQAVITAAADHEVKFPHCSAISTGAGTTCALGAPDSKQTIVLFGDSHAAMWNPTFDRLGREHGYRVIPMAMGSCPPAEVVFFFTEAGGPDEQCTQWREQAFKAIQDIHPELVVFSSIASLYAGTPDHPLPTGLMTADWTRGIERTASRFDKMGVRFAMIADTPVPGFNATNCLSRQAGAIIGGGRPCVFDRDAVNPAAKGAVRVVRGFKNGSVIDLTDVICPTRMCHVMQDGMVLYVDGDHLASVYATSLAGPMWDRLDTVLASTAHG
jgi:peptidoglycan/LPS O-acetylase OafA/YrhL